MTVYEQLKDLEAFLAGEVRSFKAGEQIAAEKGMGKATSYCMGCRLAYGNVLAKVRQIAPDALIRDVTA